MPTTRLPRAGARNARLLLPAVAASLAAGCADTPVPPSAPLAAPALAMASASAGDSSDVIVVFRRGTADAPGLARSLVAAHGGGVRYAYTHVLQGFAGRVPAAALEGLRRNPNVERVEPDLAVRVDEVQTNAPWGLDRIDQGALPLNATYDWPNNGAGVTVYILDTGIRPTHQEFAGRLVPGFSAFADSIGTNDCHGHGTHVAGTVGGTTVGVAKGVSLGPVRILNCNGSGSSSGIIAGLDWVVRSGRRPAVANMSLGGSLNSSLNTAVANAVTAGVTVVVSAGNSATDACTQSPAATPSALTVAASGSGDDQASFSNFGNCVDLYAPGVGITSSTRDGDATYAAWSGTSMAAPHVAGAAALVLAANPTATPGQVAAALVDNASAGRIVNATSGTPNRLLFTGFIGAGTPLPPPPPPPEPTPPPPPPPTVDLVAPTAAMSVSCPRQGRSCTFDGSTSTDNSGTIASWSWTVSNGASLQGRRVSYTFPAAGTYTVTLTVTDPSGNVGRVSQSVRVRDR